MGESTVKALKGRRASVRWAMESASGRWFAKVAILSIINIKGVDKRSLLIMQAKWAIPTSQ